MARYNSISATSSVAGGSTISTPASGLLTTLSGAGTVTIPNPVLYTGQTQTYYNNQLSNITLSTPSGVITGGGVAGSSTIVLSSYQVITLVSDGTNYIIQGWLGGSIYTSSLIAAGGTINAVNIGATTAGTGAFTTLGATSTTTLAGMTATTGAFSGISTFTNNASASSSTTGAIQVTGGAGIGGSLYVGGSSYVVNATNPTGWVSVDTALTTQSMYMQVNTTSSDTRIGSYTNHSLGIYTNNTVRMTVDTSGRVGIGTAPGRSFHVKGNDNWWKFEETSGAGRAWLIGTGTTTSFRIYDETANQDRFAIDSTGNVKLSTAGTKILNSSGNPILQQSGSVLQVVTNYPSSGAIYTQAVSAYAEISTAYRTSITPVSTNSILILEWVGLIGGANSSSISTMKFYDVTNNADVGLSGLSLGSRGIGHGSFRQVDTDVNDRDNIILRVVVPNSTTTARTYSLYHYSESSVTKYFNATATDNNGCSYIKWHFIIKEIAA